LHNGKDRLHNIKNNDNRKFQACIENDIELYLIDVSIFKHFKIVKAKKYLNMITKIIDFKLDKTKKSTI